MTSTVHGLVERSARPVSTRFPKRPRSTRSVRIPRATQRFALVVVLLALGLTTLVLSVADPIETSRHFFIALAVILLALGCRVAGGTNAASSR